MDMNSFKEIEGKRSPKGGGFSKNPNSITQKVLKAVPFLDEEGAEAPTLSDIVTAVDGEKKKVRRALYRLANKKKADDKGRIVQMLVGYDAEADENRFARNPKAKAQAVEPENEPEDTAPVEKKSSKKK